MKYTILDIYRDFECNYLPKYLIGQECITFTIGISCIAVSFTLYKQVIRLMMNCVIYLSIHAACIYNIQNIFRFLRDPSASEVLINAFYLGTRYQSHYIVLTSKSNLSICILLSTQ